MNTEKALIEIEHHLKADTFIIRVNGIAVATARTLFLMRAKLEEVQKVAAVLVGVQNVVTEKVKEIVL